MRTTLTLDKDVAFGLEKIKAAEPRKPFKVVVNEVLRRGLRNDGSSEKRKPFVVDSRPIGVRKDIDWNDLDGFLDQIEGDRRK
ncbi:MAG: hypothetical protein IPM59_05945 [Chloracidobacterium sp.]|nr:hypothetical protein [Chloracidobacterium sp.]